MVKISRTDRSNFQWVACPDVVANAIETCNQWLTWFPKLDYFDIPVAFVAQDGIELIPDQVPWDDMACLFLGGSTRWKLSLAAESLMREAKSRGKLVHVGRVNTLRRVRDVLMMCPLVDSIDGRSFSAWPDVKIPKGLAWIRMNENQPCLF